VAVLKWRSGYPLTVTRRHFIDSL